MAGGEAVSAIDREATYYKATRPDGTSFYDGTTTWEVGKVTTLPDGSGLPYLSVSVEPADCTGMEWPCRLFRVEPVEGHEVTTPNAKNLPNKRAATAWRVVEELPAHGALGPNGAEVAAIIERAATLTLDEMERMHAAQVAAWDAARYAARYAAWDAAWDAALATIVRNLITTEQYDILMAPWRAGIGEPQ